MAVKSSLALQDIHWTARRLKGECHMHLKQYKEAEFEFRFFNKRTFKKQSNNFPFRRQTLYNQARALIELSKYEDALVALDKAFKLEPGAENLSEADLLLYRGIARKHAGKNGFLADWNKAKKLGSKRAVQLLEAN
jgi:tetratricopeptide (TPR) repeat protein